MGTNSFIGLVDKTTILRYPLTRNDEKTLAVLKFEAKIVQLIGPHKHNIGFKGITVSGLLLAFGSMRTCFMRLYRKRFQCRPPWAVAFLQKVFTDKLNPSGTHISSTTITNHQLSSSFADLPILHPRCARPYASNSFNNLWAFPSSRLASHVSFQRTLYS